MDWIREYAPYLLAGLGALVLGLAIALLCARGRARRLADSRRIDRLEVAMRASADNTRALLERVDARAEGMARDNERRLSQIRETVDERLTENLSRSFRAVDERLQTVSRGLGEMKSLAGDVGSLQKLLRGVTSRGAWGEAQLGSLLAELLAPGQYEENVAITAGSAERVEFALRLPAGDGCVLLPIDSKFPAESYKRLIEATEAGDPQAAAQARSELSTILLGEAKKIASKYVKPPRTTEFALMYLPIESLYAEAVRLPDVAETARRKNGVLIAGPSTLAALLSSLQTGFRAQAVAKAGLEARRLFEAARGDLQKYLDATEKAKLRAEQSARELDAAGARCRALLTRIDALTAGAEDGEGDQPT